MRKILIVVLLVLIVMAVVACDVTKDPQTIRDQIFTLENEISNGKRALQSTSLSDSERADITQKVHSAEEKKADLERELQEIEAAKAK